MGASLLWTLASILFSVLLCQRSTGAALSDPPDSVYEGDTVRLSCTDHNAEEVSFYKDGSLINRDKIDDSHQYGNSRYLTIDPVSKSDEGQYSCGISEQNKSPEKLLTVTGRSREVSVTLDPNWSEVFVGERLTLRCDVEGSGHSWTYEWKRNDTTLTERTTKEFTVYVTESDRGLYSCRGVISSDHRTQWSSTTSVKVSSAALSDPPGSVYLGDTVRLVCTCYVQNELKFYKDGSLMEQDLKHVLKQTSHTANLMIDSVSTSDGGRYSCGISERTKSPAKTLTVTGRSREVSVTLDPNWSEVFVGERLTLRCDVEGSGHSWTYEWRRNDTTLTERTREFTVYVTDSDREVYSCRGEMNPDLSTQWSSTTSVKVSSASRPLLSASVSWLSPGASVSLSCAVTAPSAGWSYYWYRAVPQSVLYRYELLPEASAGTTQDSFSVQGLTNTAAFVCGAARGAPPFHTQQSQPSFVWSADAESSVSLSVSPDRAQHFTDDVITLSCGFNSTDTDWRVRRFHLNKLSTQQCDQRTDKTKCQFALTEETRAVFWCEFGSGEMSNALNISVHRNIILESPVRPVTEGQSVSLSCKLKTSVHFFSFYKNGKLVQNGTKAEFNISAVSRSDQGLYKCEAQEQKKQQRQTPRTWRSAESWMSVQTAPEVTEELSSSPVMWVIGLVCAVALLILLLLLWRYKIKDASQNSVTDQTHNATEENQQQIYSTLLHGDVDVYESISGSKQNEGDDDTYENFSNLNENDNDA